MISSFKKCKTYSLSLLNRDNNTMSLKCNVLSVLYCMRIRTHALLTNSMYYGYVSANQLRNRNVHKFQFVSLLCPRCENFPFLLFSFERFFNLHFNGRGRFYVALNPRGKLSTAAGTCGRFDLKKPIVIKI